MGRPKLAEGKAQDTVVGLRYTHDEKQKLEKEAKRKGFKTLTAYLKEKLQAS